MEQVNGRSWAIPPITINTELQSILNLSWKITVLVLKMSCLQTGVWSLMIGFASACMEYSVFNKTIINGGKTFGRVVKSGLAHTRSWAQPCARFWVPATYMWGPWARFAPKICSGSYSHKWEPGNKQKAVVIIIIILHFAVCDPPVP